MPFFIRLRNKYRLHDFQFALVIPVIILTIIGILVIGSADASYQEKQIVGLVGGIIVMLLFACIDYHKILNFYWILYILGLIALMSVLLFGDESLGATRWIDLGFIRFQPSELTKILMILFLAKFLSLNKDKISKPVFFFITLSITVIPILMIRKQPDLSTSIVLFIVCVSLIFIAEISAKIVKWVLGLGIPSFFVLFYLVTREGQKLISNYQYLRIMSWLQPENYPQSAYQQQNSIMAVGSGCIFGKGLYNTSLDSVKNGNFISEPQTDFIFAVTGEELGFVGCCVVIGLLLLISIECIWIGSKAKDLEGKLIGCGMGVLISFQSFVNICVVTGLMPNTGLPLPFMSYGLTSLISLYMGIGVVLNVGLQRSSHESAFQ